MGAANKSKNQQLFFVLGKKKKKKKNTCMRTRSSPFNTCLGAHIVHMTHPANTPEMFPYSSYLASTNSCRICVAPDSLSTQLSKHCKICAECIHQKEIPLPAVNGARVLCVRFCHGHRQLELVERFKGKQTRCRESLEKIKAARLLKAAAAAVAAAAEAEKESTSPEVGGGGGSRREEDIDIRSRDQVPEGDRVDPAAPDSLLNFHGGPSSRRRVAAVDADCTDEKGQGRPPASSAQHSYSFAQHPAAANVAGSSGSSDQAWSQIVSACGSDDDEAAKRYRQRLQMWKQFNAESPMAQGSQHPHEHQWHQRHQWHQGHQGQEEEEEEEQGVLGDNSQAALRLHVLENSSPAVKTEESHQPLNPVHQHHPLHPPHQLQHQHNADAGDACTTFASQPKRQRSEFKEAMCNLLPDDAGCKVSSELTPVLVRELMHDMQHGAMATDLAADDHGVDGWGRGSGPRGPRENGGGEGGEVPEQFNFNTSTSTPYARADIELFTDDMWLMPGSVVMHSFALRSGRGGGTRWGALYEFNFNAVDP